MLDSLVLSKIWKQKAFWFCLISGWADKVVLKVESDHIDI